MAPTERPYHPPKYSTTSCQHLVYEDLTPTLGRGTVIFQTDISHPKLLPAVTGHVVNRVPLLPSALYADMAMTAADYLHKALIQHNAGEDRAAAVVVGLNVCAVEVHRPVVAQIPPPRDGQHIQMEARADLARQEVAVTFRSVTPDGVLLQEHGHGLVKYEDAAAWAAEWQRTQFLVETQMALLEAKAAAGGGAAHKILRGLAYKLFAGFVQYAPQYQGMEEVILDAAATAGCAKVRFQVTENGADGDFFCSPYFIDNLCHLSGFIANASDLQNPDMTFISHGWRAFKVADPKALSAKKEYSCYVKMVEGKSNVTAGDVYVFEGRKVVAVFYGCKFQGIPKRAMDVLLSPGKPKKSVRIE